MRRKQASADYHSLSEFTTIQASVFAMRGSVVRCGGSILETNRPGLNVISNSQMAVQI